MLLCFSTVTKDETLKLLYCYRTITTDKIDRVKFCDLLHNTFGMTDDYFMDKGVLLVLFRMGLRERASCVVPGMLGHYLQLAKRRIFIKITSSGTISTKYYLYYIYIISTTVASLPK